MPQPLLRFGAFLAFWLAATMQASAHQGPPFPVIVDRTAGPYVISVWTDPDVGIGKFFVFVEAAGGSRLSGARQVQVCVQPIDGRLPEACYPAVLQEQRSREQYYAEVEFDRQEMWKVRVLVTGSEGTGEVSAEVEATPPGLGKWDLLFYGFPFILFGSLWAYAALRRHRAPRPQPKPDAVS
jgi:hypothetical protein